jgi:hypothetical protein
VAANRIIRHGAENGLKINIGGIEIINQSIMAWRRIEEMAGISMALKRDEKCAENGAS